MAAFELLLEQRAAEVSAKKAQLASHHGTSQRLSSGRLYNTQRQQSNSLATQSGSCYCAQLQANMYRSKSVAGHLSKHQQPEGTAAGFTQSTCTQKLEYNLQTAAQVLWGSLPGQHPAQQGLSQLLDYCYSQQAAPSAQQHTAACIQHQLTTPSAEAANRPTLGINIANSNVYQQQPSRPGCTTTDGRQHTAVATETQAQWGPATTVGDAQNDSPPPPTAAAATSPKSHLTGSPPHPTEGTPPEAALAMPACIGYASLMQTYSSSTTGLSVELQPAVRVKLHAPIGSGTFGAVYRGVQETVSGCIQVAIKVFRCSNSVDYHTERSALKMLHGKQHILQLLGEGTAWQKGQPVQLPCLVLQLAECNLAFDAPCNIDLPESGSLSCCRGCAPCTKGAQRVACIAA